MERKQKKQKKNKHSTNRNEGRYLGDKLGHKGRSEVDVNEPWARNLNLNNRQTPQPSATHIPTSAAHLKYVNLQFTASATHLIMQRSTHSYMHRTTDSRFITDHENTTQTLTLAMRGLLGKFSTMAVATARGLDLGI